MIFDYTYKIRERDLDSYGHVNNAAYLTIYEEARWEFVRTNNLLTGGAQKLGYGPVILEINLKFKKELRNQQEVTIRSDFRPFKGKITIIHQEILRDGEVCSTADFTMGIFDLKARKLIDPPPDWNRVSQG